MVMTAGGRRGLRPDPHRSPPAGSLATGLQDIKPYCPPMLFRNNYPEVRRLRTAYPGQIHPESSGALVARQVPQVHRLPSPTRRQVLCQKWTSLL
ncbi:hypothetical protein TNCT_211161 [Trichonephila clavata]|uniref:Uncharacterized protein n=1 Tax=Trichonephila clavata TaxID=2740835 RepID=A0A8X6HZ95_TRICU|nr:hypothetical protein TNCT_211161 [Trichonephila clavata]